MDCGGWIRINLKGQTIFKRTTGNYHQPEPAVSDPAFCACNDLPG